MQIEGLPRSKWHELEGLPGDQIQTLDADKVVAFVARDEGQIVGRLYVIFQPLISGIWVRDSHRGKGVALMLEQAVEQAMKTAGMQEIFTNARTGSRIEKYLKRIGFSLPAWRQWSKKLV